MGKIKLYALKINDSIAQCPVLEKPLMGPYTAEYARKLLNIKTMLTEKYPELNYGKAKLVKLVESQWC